jgi:hypothetical protein
MGAIPTGTVSGAISTSSSSAVVTFAPTGEVTNIFGTFPGVSLTSGYTTDTFQTLPNVSAIYDPSDPSVGPGVATIAGDVSEIFGPEPMTLSMLGGGLIGLGLLKRKRFAR